MKYKDGEDMETKYDLIILGQGAAAFAAAIKANELGIKTAMIGGNATPGTVIGGTCVNVGCLPSKNLITVANVFHYAANNSFEGIKYEKGALNFRKAIEQKDRLVAKFRKEKYADLIENLENVTYIEGRGRFVSKNSVEVDGKKIEGGKFIVAVGARSNIIPVKGLDEINYLTNEEALDLKELPESLCVVGGRALGLEFAQMFSHFGTKVTVLQRSERVIPEEEPEISDALRQYLEEEGIKIYTGMNINFVKKSGSKKTVNFSVKGSAKEIEADHILFATGRKPNTDGLHLDKADVKLDEKGFVKVNSEMQTSASHVFAAGDVIGEPMLETIAAKEGAVAVENAFGKARKKINFSEVPRAVFTYPEVASVGLTDAQAISKGIRCSCRTLPLSFVPKAHIIGDTRGLVKIVTDNQTKRIVGVHILAPHAADIIHEGTLAVKFKLAIDDIIDTVHVFPTLSESVKLAAQSFYKDVSKMSCCTE
ncbi:MAG: mercury(II) reductase [Candidatus Aenigmarchaeota archaeon]|nr:mercury(II) reductase [Candidatus Aenigmarchaeota archaeon]